MRTDPAHRCSAGAPETAYQRRQGGMHVHTAPSLIHVVAPVVAGAAVMLLLAALK